MFKTKLIAAALALGVSGFANASFNSTDSGNGEFVFSAFDAVAGVGYTYDLSDLGWNDVFGSDVKMNSVIGSTNTTSAISSTLPANASGVLFDVALPSFSAFVAGGSASGLQWNVVAGDNNGTRRLVQTVAAAPSAALKNSDLNSAIGNFNNYLGAVNSKGTHADGNVLGDGYALTTSADGLAYAGGIGSSFAGKGYASTGGVNDVLSLYVFGSTSTSASSTALGRVAAVKSVGGQDVVARIYEGVDGYHLQISAVPEPETYAMLLAGLGLLGFAVRRKNA